MLNLVLMERRNRRLMVLCRNFDLFWHLNTMSTDIVDKMIGQTDM